MYYTPRVNAKIKFALETATKAQRGLQVSSTLSLTSTLYGVGGQRHASADLAPGKTRYSLYRRLGGIQSRSGSAENLAPTVIQSPDRPARSGLRTKREREKKMS